MNHIEDAKLIEFLNGELTESDSKIIAEHLSACEKCSKESEALSKVIGALSSFESEPSQEFASSLLLKVKEEATYVTHNKMPVNAPKQKSWFHNSSIAGRIVLAIGSIAAVIVLTFAARATLLPNNSIINPPTAFGPVSTTNSVDISINEAYSDEFQNYLDFQLDDVGGKIVEEFNSDKNSMSVEIPYSILSYFTRKFEVSYDSTIDSNTANGANEVFVNFNFTE